MRNLRKTVSCLLVLSTIISVIPFFTSCALITGEDTSKKENLFLELLKLVPASAENRDGFFLIDYRKYFQQNGVSLNVTGDTEKNREYLRQLVEDNTSKKYSEAITPIVLGSYYTGHSEYTLTSPVTIQNIGYDFTYADAEIQDIYHSFFSQKGDVLRQKYPAKLVAAIGQYDALTTEQALTNQETWPDWAAANYSTEKYRDIIIHYWKDGDINHLDTFLKPPCLDRLGRAPVLAIDNGRLLIADTVNDIKLMIDSSLKKTPTLADVPEYALAAQALLKLNVPIACIVDDSLVNQSLLTPDEDEPSLDNFLTCSFGLGKDSKGTYIALALVHDNALEASSNVKLLNARLHTQFHSIPPSYFTWNNQMTKWSDSFFKGMEPEGIAWSYSEAFTEIEISSQGKVLLAKLYTTDKELWYQWFLLKWGMLIHK